MNRHILALLRRPLVILWALLLVSCQAGAADPTPSDVAKVPSAAPVATTPAVELSGAEAQQEIELTATPSDKQGDNAGEDSPEIAGEEQQDATSQDRPVGETAAANADVEFVQATQAADGTWRFDVTVRHPDTGWEDYADGWDVVTPDGQVLKRDESDPFTRLLRHPHENEQPFTRSQSGLVVPADVPRLTVRAHDLLDGFGGQEIEIDLTVDQGPGFEVNRQ